MDIPTWRAMLERRGYHNITIEQQGRRLYWSVEGILAEMRGMAAFTRLTYKGARKEIDDLLGHGMVHVFHTCGCPLLKASAGYERDEPFYRQEMLQHVQFYPVPLYPGSPSLLMCPQCGKVLLREDVHRVTDPEARQQE